MFFTSPGQCIFKIFFTDEMSGDIFVVLKLTCLENEDPVQICLLFKAVFMSVQIGLV